MVRRFARSQAGLKQLSTHYHLENVPKSQTWLHFGMSQTTSRKESGYGAARCFRVPPWYMHNASSPPTSQVHTRQPCGHPCVQPSLGVPLVCLVGTDRGHRWGGVLLGAHCHMSCELSLRPCPACSVQGLFCLESGHREFAQNRRAGEIEERLIKLSQSNLRAVAFPLWSLGCRRK